MSSVIITTFSASGIEPNIKQLGQLLHACVLEGANINFVLPYSETDAEDFWKSKVLPALQTGQLLMLVALVNGEIAGSVQLDCDTPANQKHRAEVRKLLVHPRFRRMGIARALMLELEQQAAKLNRTLLTLDTLTGDKAEPLYTSLGYQTLGVIPGFCRDTATDELLGATFMYKHLPVAKDS